MDPAATSTSIQDEDSASASSSRPHGLPQRPALFVDTDVCHTSSGLPTSTQMGPPTCSMFGPRTSSDSSWAVSTAAPRIRPSVNAVCDKRTSSVPRLQHMQQQQPQHSSCPAASTSGPSTASPWSPRNSSRKSLHPKVMFDDTSTSSSDGTVVQNPTARTPPGRCKSGRFSTAAVAGAANNTPSTAVVCSSSGSGASRSSVAAPHSSSYSSSSPQQARAASVATAKHYGAWFLPAQAWGYASHINPGSTW